MIRKTVAALYLFAGATMTVLAAKDEVRYRVQRFAQTEKVSSAHMYVLVRLARGDYNNLNGPETMMYDYKFFKTITTDINAPLD